MSDSPEIRRLYERLERDAAVGGPPSVNAAIRSQAISLKRIADALEKLLGTKP